RRPKLGEIATKIEPGAHAILTLEQAGWHGESYPSRYATWPLSVTHCEDWYKPLVAVAYRWLRVAYHLSASLIFSAVRSDSPASVSVGLPLAIVVNVPRPTRYGLSWSHERWSAFTTELLWSVPIR